MEYESPITLFAEIGDYLNEPIQMNRPDVIKTLYRADALRLKLGEAIKNTSFMLNTRRMAVKQPKDKYVTDLDREIDVKGATAQMDADLQFLQALQIIVSEHIETAKLWLT